MAVSEIELKYQELFGQPKVRPSLFAPDDEQYNNLRQSIVNSPLVFFDDTSLPFSDLKVAPYQNFLREKAIQDATKDNHKVFFLESPGICDAIGYFGEKDCCFYLLPSSTFRVTLYFEVVSTDICKSIRSLLSKKDNMYTLIRTYKIPTASLAASMILGKKTDYKGWATVLHEKLEDAFPSYFDESILSSLDEESVPTIQEVSASSSAPKNLSLKRIIYYSRTKDSHNGESFKIVSFNKDSLSRQNEQNKVVDSKPNSTQVEINPSPGATSMRVAISQDNLSKHLFRIKRDGVCNAVGVLLEEDQKYSFRVLLGSYVHHTCTSEYLDTNDGKKRYSFLFKSSQDLGDCYKLCRNIKFESAAAAASFVLGDIANESIWVDDQGKTIMDVYPQYFPQEESAPIDNIISRNYVFPIEEINIFDLN